MSFASPETPAGDRGNETPSDRGDDRDDDRRDDTKSLIISDIYTKQTVHT